MIIHDDVPEAAQFPEKYPKNQPVRSFGALCDRRFPGLIVFEGIDTAGKSTVARIIGKHLKPRVQLLVLHKSSALTKHVLLKAKWEGSSPEVRAHILAAALAETISITLPTHLGDWILFDRYIYSVIVQALARGVSGRIVGLEALFPLPELIVYMDHDPVDGWERRESEQRPMSFWECGQDLFPQMARRESFIAYQNVVREYYARLFTDRENVVWIDATHSIETIAGKVLSHIRRLESWKTIM